GTRCRRRRPASWCSAADNIDIRRFSGTSLGVSRSSRELPGAADLARRDATYDAVAAALPTTHRAKEFDMTNRLELTTFKALSFDCYGTLIDWEAGIADVL